MRKVSGSETGSNGRRGADAAPGLQELEAAARTAAEAAAREAAELAAMAALQAAEEAAALAASQPPGYKRAFTQKSILRASLTRAFSSGRPKTSAGAAAADDPLLRASGSYARLRTSQQKRHQQQLHVSPGHAGPESPPQVHPAGRDAAFSPGAGGSPHSEMGSTGWPSEASRPPLLGYSPVGRCRRKSGRGCGGRYLNPSSHLASLGGSKEIRPSPPLAAAAAAPSGLKLHPSHDLSGASQPRATGNPPDSRGGGPGGHQQAAHPRHRLSRSSTGGGGSWQLPQQPARRLGWGPGLG